MKKCITILLLFMLFLSALNFSFAVDLNEKNDNDISAGISNVFSVQYEIYKQTKNVVINISDVIIKDVILLLSVDKGNKLFIDNKKLFVSNSQNNYFKYLRVPFFNNCRVSLYSNRFIQINLLIFMFIFIFLIRYLGLLRVFWSLIITLYKKGSMWDLISYASFLFTRGIIYEY